jgi:putative ABC transport system permease protein
VLVGVFGGLAVLLAAAGIYGLFSQLVNRRTQELGVRVALGASAGHVAALVLGQTLLVVAGGLAAGCLGALSLTSLLAGQLQGVTATDPVTFAAIAVFIIALALTASAVPTIRAIRIDPVIALRQS